MRVNAGRAVTAPTTRWLEVVEAVYDAVRAVGSRGALGPPQRQQVPAALAGEVVQPAVGAGAPRAVEEEQQVLVEVARRGRPLKPPGAARVDS